MRRTRTWLLVGAIALACGGDSERGETHGGSGSGERQMVMPRYADTSVCVACNEAVVRL